MRWYCRYGISYRDLRGLRHLRTLGLTAWGYWFPESFCYGNLSLRVRTKFTAATDIETKLLRFSDLQLANVEKVLLSRLRDKALDVFGKDGVEPPWPCDPVDVLYGVKAAFDRAVAFRLEEEPEIFKFLAFDRDCGPGFEILPRYADALETLQRTDLMAVQKIMLVEVDIEATGETEGSETTPW